MERKFLADLGLTEDIVEKVMAQNGQDTEKAKGDSGKLSAELEGVKFQLAEANATIKGLKDLDPEALSQQVKDWDTKYKSDTQALKDLLAKQKLDGMVDIGLLSAKARNVKAVRALLDPDKIKLDGEKLIGLEEQIQAITKENPYLFGEEEKNPVPGNGNTTQSDDIAKWRAEAGLPPIPKGE